MKRDDGTRCALPVLAIVVAGVVLTAVAAPTATAAGTVTYDPLVAIWVANMSQAFEQASTVDQISGRTGVEA